MKKSYLVICLLIISISTAFAQVGINTDGNEPDPSAMLDVSAPDKGLLPPRVALTAINMAEPVVSPATGLFVYNTATSGTSPDNVQPGYYCWNGTRWISVIVPQGTNTGEMLFWNGTQWIAIPVGANGQVLTLVNGIPTWGQSALQLPTVITTPVSEITDHSAVSGGNSSDGGTPVTSRGVCWSTNDNPTVTDNKTEDGMGSGAFSSNISGLTTNTTYYIRAYAVNSVGIGYGNVLSFTPCPANYSATISILPSQAPACAGAPLTLTAISANGGVSPFYQWLVNGLNTGPNSPTLTYLPSNGDQVLCVMTSSEPCLFLPAVSNSVIITMDSIPEIPVPGYQVPTITQITWNWNIVEVADGYRWSAINDYNTAADLGNTTFMNESNLTCNTQYTRYVWAYNSCGHSLPVTLSQSTEFIPPSMPVEGNHGALLDQITWNWYSVPEATGYKWNTIDDYASAMDLNLMTSFTEYGLLCNTLYTRYVWAYDACGNSAVTVLSQFASPIPPPSPSPMYHDASPTQITWNWTSSPDAFFYKWSTINDFNTGIETGTSYTETGLTCDSLYTRYVWACNPCNHSDVTILTQATQPCTGPVLNTNEIIDITLISATGGGNLIMDGGSPVMARGVCWSTSPNPTLADSHSSDGSGMGGFTSYMSGLIPNTLYFVRAYATNSTDTGYGNEVTFTTTPATVIACEDPITINHVAGDVAPVSKTVIYSTVTNIPGEPSKCWIASNLGADHQATAMNDTTEASAGWYWQFNRKQGYKHNGTTRTPNTVWITSINENFEWQTANDPCSIILGGTWRVPTKSEWYNLCVSGGWTSVFLWNSALKIHRAGFLQSNNGSLNYRGSTGNYWSSTQNSPATGFKLAYGDGGSFILNDYKIYGYTLRCIRD
jgi:hypothetical protein